MLGNRSLGAVGIRQENLVTSLPVGVGCAHALAGQCWQASRERGTAVGRCISSSRLGSDDQAEMLHHQSRKSNAPHSQRYQSNSGARVHYFEKRTCGTVLGLDGRYQLARRIAAAVAAVVVVVAAAAAAAIENATVAGLRREMPPW